MDSELELDKCRTTHNQTMNMPGCRAARKRRCSVHPPHYVGSSKFLVCKGRNYWNLSRCGPGGNLKSILCFCIAGPLKPIVAKSDGNYSAEGIRKNGYVSSTPPPSPKPLNPDALHPAQRPSSCESLVTRALSWLPGTVLNHLETTCQTLMPTLADGGELYGSFSRAPLVFRGFPQHRRTDKLVQLPLKVTILLSTPQHGIFHHQMAC